MARSRTKRRDVIALERFLPYRVALLDDRLLIKNSNLHVGLSTDHQGMEDSLDHRGLWPAHARRDSPPQRRTSRPSAGRSSGWSSAFLVKRAAAGDGRTFHVALGKAGWAYYDAIVPKARALEREALKALTPAELKELRRLIEKLTPI
jgi:hypothetical protein